jgi:glycosyltransferase involved in cell wall biosynthesis
MRVLHVIPKLVIGGAERLALDMLHEQNKRAGVNAELIYWEPVFEHAEKDRAHTHRLPFEFASRLLRFDVGHTIPAQDFIQKFKPDVIHSHLFQAEWVARCVPQKGIKYLSSVHDNIRQLQPSLRFFSKQDLVAFWERYYTLSLYRQTRNHFLAISEDTRNYLHQVLPANMHPRIVLLKNAVPLNRFAFPERPDWQPGQTLHLINVGSFVPKKNQAMALDVLQELLKVGIDTRLTFAGDGPLKSQVQQQAEAKGVQNRCSFLGNVQNIEAHYRHADLYLHTAWEEPFGLVLVEAMASGLSVVALDAGGNRELIQDGINGRLLPRQASPSEVALSIQTWMSQASAQRHARKNALEFAAEFGMPAYVDALLNHYTQLQPA